MYFNKMIWFNLIYLEKIALLTRYTYIIYSFRDESRKLQMGLKGLVRKIYFEEFNNVMMHSFNLCFISYNLKMPLKFILNFT